MKQCMLLLLIVPCLAHPQDNGAPKAVEKWRRFEIVLPGPSQGNPFMNVWIAADFTCNGNTVKATGFYDGNGTYKIRLMPDATGEWTFTTHSNSKALNGKKGRFTCTGPLPTNHGPVKVVNTYGFQYADGKRFYPFGTTLYAWIHQGEALQKLTLHTLAAAPFNKVRMCVFPKAYTYVDDDPELYPYVKIAETITDGKTRFQWDFTRFDPAFFKHLEDRIDDLDKLNIQADLILFHPYDKGKWGFDSMGRENDLRYLRYLAARLSAFKNVWWSMANEFDYITSKPRQDWDAYTKAVVNNDPSHHLCSIHNGSIYYDNWKPEFTHASIQNGAPVEDFGRAALLRDVYFKPVIYDEVCYEGNLKERWGRLSGEEMTAAFWQGIIAGTYVTHGETYRNSGDTIFWAEGGRLVGSSPARIGFLRKLMEEGPGPLQLADEWKDNQTSQADSNYYLIYFGKQMQNEWAFNLPKKNAPAPGARFRAEIIDTWNMTITPVAETFQLAEPNDYRMFDRQMKKIRLPLKPYLAIRLYKM